MMRSAFKGATWGTKPNRPYERELQAEARLKITRQGGPLVIAPMVLTSDWFQTEMSYAGWGGLGSNYLWLGAVWMLESSRWFGLVWGRETCVVDWCGYGAAFALFLGSIIN
jgi:hypothetical protein